MLAIAGWGWQELTEFERVPMLLGPDGYERYVDKETAILLWPAIGLGVLLTVGLALNGFTREGSWASSAFAALVMVALAVAQLGAFTTANT